MSDFTSGLGDMARDLANEHGDKIGDAAQQAGDFADEKTGGKYSDQIDSGVGQVQEHFGDQDAQDAQDAQGSEPQQGSF